MNQVLDLEQWRAFQGCDSAQYVWVMLTEIFAYRYQHVPIWCQFTERERRLIVQGFRILSERVCPYYHNGQVSDFGKAFWTDIHSRLSMELGLPSLSPLAYSYNTMHLGNSHTVTGTWTMNTVCENWMNRLPQEGESVDEYIKERLSLVEIGLRKREEQIAAQNAELPRHIVDARLRASRKASTLPGDAAAYLIQANAETNATFQSIVEELNTRFKQAGCGLHYHNGFIQRSQDQTVLAQIEAPFWQLVADPKWKNVDTDMKEAVDRRDTGARDPAFYAARALESSIKIVSDEKKWTRGNERGAANYIDNLGAQQAGYILPWESEVLKLFFSKVRNPLGHGPGSEEMPALGGPQTNWAIEFCMSWIKSLIRRP